MTEGIKGTKPAANQLPTAKEMTRREKAEEPAAREPAFVDKVTTRSVEEIAARVAEATESIRELEARAAEPARREPSPRVAESVPPSDVGEASGVPSEGGVEVAAVEDESAPIRSPEEATRVAERVAREIVQRPPEALAVNINVAAVRALFS